MKMNDLNLIVKHTVHFLLEKGGVEEITIGCNMEILEFDIARTDGSRNLFIKQLRREPISNPIGGFLRKNNLWLMVAIDSVSFDALAKDKMFPLRIRWGLVKKSK